MRFAKECWLALLETFNALMGMPTDDNQQSLGFGSWPGDGNVPHIPHVPDNPFPLENDLLLEEDNPLIFRPPSHDQNGKSDFVCNYTAMGKGWRHCSTSEDRGCWLQGPGTNQVNISTDYEHYAPIGITRRYELNVTNITINADGLPMTEGKVFNLQYPGPWIEACWGDQIEITVRNWLPHNGTAIHWHGIRMLGTTEMDGVNAVSQCPIAPGEEFTYKFNTTQYGTSWYHSHYSLQYGDGLLGPLTIHGPSTGNYDDPIDPILMTDWNHRSAFMDFQTELEDKDTPKMDSILLNGKGNYLALREGNEKYNKTVKYGKKYLFRLINTSVDTTFVFSIDHHNLTVITTDFVPIHPYSVNHLLIGIGQRYHVIVEAKPLDTNDTIIQQEDATAYWIRTIPANGCNSFRNDSKPDERQGILNYRKDRVQVPETEKRNFSLACRDEKPEHLVPYLAWNITATTKLYEELFNQKFEVGIEEPKPPNGRPFPCDRFHRWTIGQEPMFLNFSDPTILHLKDNPTKFQPSDVVVDYANITADAWIYMVIIGMYAEDHKKHKIDVDRTMISAAHPMHLHGHDFALLQQSDRNFSQENFNPNFRNPPRRDVVLLPSGGFIVIAFKADNPGAWAFHCHIAWHASSGLALQIMERPSDAQSLLDSRPDEKKEIHRTCDAWKKWYSNTTNFWDPQHDQLGFQDDSGV